MTSRLAWFQGMLLAAMGLLVVRLAQLQLVQGASYYQLAENNRTRLVHEQAPRGLIVDRAGRILADSQTVFRVAIVPQEIQRFADLLAFISRHAHRPVDELRREFTAARSLPFMPAVILPNVSKDLALLFEEAQWRFPGLLVRPESVRRYPRGATLAQLLGYLSQPTAEELPLLKQYGVRPKTLIGRLGLERSFDHELRGRSGGLMVEVNHRGRQVRVLGRRAPEAGERLTLTVDASLQSLIQEAFGPQPGAAVALDPSTGAVLALVSNPTFTPESFVTPETSLVRRFLSDPQTPLMNRATLGVYQPGSIIKLLTAASALEHGMITPDTSIVCTGAMRIGDRTIRCWNRDGHGPLNLSGALMQSCNVYFMQIGRWLGTARMRETMEQAGLSKRTGWPYGEEAGHLPRRRLMEGEVAMLAIGQGEILVTAMQAAIIGAVFANGGRLVKPWVVSAVGERVIAPPAAPQRVGWSEGTIRAIREGMTAVVRDAHGTGHRAFNPTVSIAGKTGTAQTHVAGQNNAWFVGFCPVEHPRVAMAIVAEQGGSGGDLPAVIARTLCEYVATVDSAAGPP